MVGGGQKWLVVTSVRKWQICVHDGFLEQVQMYRYCGLGTGVKRTRWASRQPVDAAAYAASSGERTWNDV